MSRGSNISKFWTFQANIKSPSIITALKKRYYFTQKPTMTKYMCKLDPACRIILPRHIMQPINKLPKCALWSEWQGH